MNMFLSECKKLVSHNEQAMIPVSVLDESANGVPLFSHMTQVVIHHVVWRHVTLMDRM